MATASTKQRRKQNRPGSKPAAEADAPGPEAAEVSERFWMVAGACVLLVAALLRLYALELKPLHHDEGVNGFFLTGLFRRWDYRYDPTNYHGPTLYYFALPFTLGLGLKTYAVRLVPVIFGTGCVWLVLCLRRYLGAAGALAAAALVAVSPGAVYYSRYFIHEMMFVFFTLGLVVAVLKAYEGAPREVVRGDDDADSKAGVWGAAVAVVAAVLSVVVAMYPQAFAAQMPLIPVTARTFLLVLIGLSFAGIFVAPSMYGGERAVYLLLASASAALLFATKETAFISAVVLVLASLIAWWDVRYMRGRERPFAERSWGGARSSSGRERPPAGTGVVERLGGWTRLRPALLTALAVFVFINVAFYSSFFTNAKGVTDSLKALNVWAETGTSEFHGKPWHTYFKWLLQEEAPLLALGAAGSALALWRGRNRFAVFAGAWAFGTLAAYSLVPYKTPWLVLNFSVPMAIAGGYAVSVLDAWALRAKRTRVPAIVLAGAALCACAYQTFVLNFREYDNDRYPYVYAHTRREFLSLVNEIEGISKRAGTGTDTRIAVTSKQEGGGTDSYWPMPWYLNDYKSVGYHGSIPFDAPQMPVVVGNVTQEAQLRTTLGATHVKVGGKYPLRPGVDLVLYARRDLAGR